MIKYFAWVIMELLSPFTLLLGAMFLLANVRQAKIAERQNVIDIPQSFKVACKAKPFWTMVLAIVLEALIFLAGIILIGIAGALLGAIGLAISTFVNTVAPGIIILIFLAPAILICLVYCIIMPLLFAPTAYIIETNPDVGAGDAISICFNTMKSRGKGTCFLNLFIPALVEGAILGFGAAIELVILWFIPDQVLAFALAIIFAVIFLVGFALVAPMFALARKISNKSLFEDIVLDPVNASKRTSGVNIKKCKGVKFDPASYENELALLFDETYSDRVPVPETPSARKKRELAERKAARASYAQPVVEEAPLTPEPAPAPVEQPAPEPVTVPVPEPANTAEADDEDDGGLITVSDLIRDVEVEEPALPQLEAVEPEEEEPAPAEPEPPEAPAEEPAQTETVAETAPEEPAKPAKKTTRKAASKSAAEKTDEEN